MVSKSTKAAEKVNAPLVMVSLGARQRTLPAREYIILDRLIPNLTPLSCHRTVPLNFKIVGYYCTIVSPRADLVFINS
jgi:hypothetical protein